MAPTTLPEAAAREQLATQPEPVYPPIAKAARIQGDVVLSIVVDEQGQIVSEKVVSGPAMLQQAALDAVKEWRYRPYMLNGDPVEVETTVNVVFHLQH